jgi:hypothetical protein
VNNLQMLAEAPWYTAVDGGRTLFILLMGPMLMLGRRMAPDSRGRYLMATAMLTALVPVTALTILDLGVDLSWGSWLMAVFALVLLAVIPFYFRIALTENNWWRGRAGKLRTVLSRQPRPAMNLKEYR